MRRCGATPIMTSNCKSYLLNSHKCQDSLQIRLALRAKPYL
ncbi:protein of unknown function (plasmid) [Cupriavidus taiwanensis]|uniref:Uncharacterized protein n=1 Tax=Cupriavidus taiwanensis TaxID=164546 RepID=A0A375IWA2_9BURK|nr:protein of unknown function [Cupriavidus taiwanensis]